MHIQGKITLQDYIAAQNLHLKQFIRTKNFFVRISIIFIVFAVLIYISNLRLELSFLVITLTFILTLPVLFFVIRPHQFKRQYNQHKALPSETKIQLHHDGIFFEDSTAQGLLPWAHIHKHVTNSQLTLIYRTDNLFHMIPKHFFTSDSDYMLFITRLNNQTQPQR